MSTVPDTDEPGPPPPSPPRRRAPGGRGPRDPLGPDSVIGARLRELFAETEHEPIPTDLVDLLEQLDEAERKGHEA
jgi:hypothetical protein